MKTKTRKKPSPRVRHISVSRVYNTGNYTNVKYEIGAEVPRGASATGTLRELVHVITMLKPFRKPESIERLEEARKKTAEEQSTWEKEHLEQWSEESAAYHQRCADRTAALQSLDDLGGSMEKRDAKNSWVDDDDTPW